jgi:hypothetical protein
MTTLVPKVDFKNGGSTPTGAVNRSSSDKLQDFISVKDFGAVGDGSTDDTTAITNCWNYVATLNGGTVYYPTGVYKVTSLVHPNVPITHIGSQQWVTAGTRPTTIVGSGTTVFYIGHYSTNQGAAGTQITNINIRGNGSTQTTGTNTALRINCGFISLNNVSCNYCDTGLELNIGVYSTYIGCTFYGQTYGVNCKLASTDIYPAQNGGYQALSLISCSTACNWTSSSSPSTASYGFNVEPDIQFFAGNIFINLIAANTAGAGIRIAPTTAIDGNTFINPWIENIKPSSYWYQIVQRQTIIEPYWRVADSGVNDWGVETILQFGGSFQPTGLACNAVLGTANLTTTGRYDLYSYAISAVRNALMQKYSLMSASSQNTSSGYSENPLVYSSAQEIAIQTNSAVSTTPDLAKVITPTATLNGYVDVDFSSYGPTSSNGVAASAKRYFEVDSGGTVTFTTVGTDFSAHGGGISFINLGSDQFKITATGLNATSRLSARVKAYAVIAQNTNYGVNLVDLT